MDRDAGEISELVQNRLAIGVGNSANAAEETPLQLALRGAQHDQLYQLSSSGVTKVSVLPDAHHAIREFVETVYLRGWRIPINPGSHTSVAATPGRGLCCQAEGEHNARFRAGTFLWTLFCAAAVAYWRRYVGQYWQQRQAPAWLASLTTLKPETSVTVKSLLDSLATLPAQNKAQEVLLDVVLDEAKIGVASMLGSRVRGENTGWFADDKQRKSVRSGLLAG